MNGVQDMGGMDNFGPINPEVDEPVFHEDWERQMFALVIALLPLGQFRVDEIRRITELIPPIQYLSSKYYEKWLISTENILLEKNIVTEGELKSGKADKGKEPLSIESIPAESIQYAMTNPMPANLDVELPAKFKSGDKILAKNINPLHHTRIPRYVRGHIGVVEKDHGVFLLPDTNAHGGPDKPEHVYTVRFEASELWGEASKDAVFIDLFDSYMDLVD